MLLSDEACALVSRETQLFKRGKRKETLIKRVLDLISRVEAETKRRTTLDRTSHKSIFLLVKAVLRLQDHNASTEYHGNENLAMVIKDARCIWKDHLTFLPLTHLWEKDWKSFARLVVGAKISEIRFRLCEAFLRGDDRVREALQEEKAKWDGFGESVFGKSVMKRVRNADRT